MKNTNGKKVRMLLVYPDYTDRDSAGRTSGGNYSEGLASISAVLKQSGHQVELMHLLYLHEEADFKSKLIAQENQQEAGFYDIIGFSIRTTALPDSKNYIKWAKEVCPEAFVICGSYHVTLVPEEVLTIDGVDAVCVGDGEYAELDLCNAMTEGVDYTDIESLYFKLPDGSFKKNPVRPIFEDLERIPIPDFDLFDYDNLDSVKINTAIVMMSRGCLFSCTYCGNSQFRNVYPNRKKYARFRSPENSILYLKTLLNKHPQIKYLNFRDAIFNMYPAWFDEFIELYKKEINLPFTCNLRFDVLTEDTVIKMKEAGCYTIDIGVESGDNEIRTKYLKRVMTDEMMIDASEWFHKHGINVLTYNIVGLPYEDLHRALKTIKLNARLKSDRIIANIFYPYPMTVLHDIAKEAGFVPDVIPPDCRVPLKQKQFPEHEVLFAANFFMYYVKRYKWAFKHGRIGRIYEKWLDFWFTGPITPRRLLVFISDLFESMRKTLRRILVNNFPKLYLFLRNGKLKKQAQNVVK
ncbi:MAG: radical SAM protein [Eubacteriales bacterium]|jgi:anaerobic magnesium-protoporphyrin IX monomethyl ester cyclase|nr:radical SAM protein [Eubacteriales bacterium]